MTYACVWSDIRDPDRLLLLKSSKPATFKLGLHAVQHSYMHIAGLCVLFDTSNV